MGDPLPRGDDPTEPIPVPTGKVPTGNVPTGNVATGPVRPDLRRGVRVCTVVFGLVMLAISVLSLLVLLTGVRIDGTVAALSVLAGAGAALLLGGLSAAVRELRRAEGR